MAPSRLGDIYMSGAILAPPGSSLREEPSSPPGRDKSVRGCDLHPSSFGVGALRRWLAWLPKAVLVALLALAILDMLAGVLLRYVVVALTDYFDLPGINFFWVEEVGEFTLAWLALVGAALALVERTHFALAVLIHRLPVRVGKLIDRANHVLIAGFGLVVAVYGTRLSITNSVLASPALEMNLGWLYGAAAVGGALITIYSLAIAAGGFDRQAAAEFDRS
jgi:TRAP-type C4-dicarboxylate transport system permease small subunit